MRHRYYTILESEKPVLVNLYAHWCSDCDRQLNILTDYAKIIDGSIKLARFNIELYKKDADQLNIKSVPALLLYIMGNEVWRHEGVIELPMLQQQIAEKLIQNQFITTDQNQFSTSKN